MVMHVFVAQHQGVKVKILDVAGNKCCARVGNNAVYEGLGCLCIGSWGSDWDWVVDEVSSGCEAYLVCLLFMQSDIFDKAGVCVIATRCHGRPWDEVDVVGATLAVVLGALGKADELPRIYHVTGFLVGTAF